MSPVNSTDIRLAQRNSTRTLYTFLRDHQRALCLRDQYPQMISVQVLSITKPSDAPVRCKLMNTTMDIQPKCIPVKLSVCFQSAGRGCGHSHVMRVRIPVRPFRRFQDMPEYDRIRRFNKDLVVGEEVRLFRPEFLRPVNVRASFGQVLLHLILLGLDTTGKPG